MTEMTSKEKHAAYMRDYFKDRPEAYEKKKARDRARYKVKREELLAYQNDYYTKNRDHIRARISIAGKKQRERLRSEAMIKLGNACMDCGIDNRMVLQFHHRDPSLKMAEVMSLANSTNRFWQEVDKCDLVCANCHLIRHGGEVEE